MSGRRAWIRLALSGSVSLGLLLALAPLRPEQRLSRPAAITLGAAVGLALSFAAARRRPSLGGASLGKFAFLAVAAASEEILWRGIVLGELLRSGAVAALAGSTLGFALAHRARPGLHLATGAAFGGAYLATGVLAASIAAHWLYNALLLACLEAEREPGRVPPGRVSP